MQDPTPLEPPEQDLEGALASLALPPAGIPAESLWYQAGLARERRRTNCWRAAAAVALVAAGAAFLWRPKPITVAVDRIVVVRDPEKPPAVVPAPADASWSEPDVGSGPRQFASTSYLRLRDRVLRGGLVSLPPTAGGQGDAAAGPRAWPPSTGAGTIESPGNSIHTFFQGG